MELRTSVQERHKISLKGKAWRNQSSCDIWMRRWKIRMAMVTTKSKKARIYKKVGIRATSKETILMSCQRYSVKRPQRPNRPSNKIKYSPVHIQRLRGQLQRQFECRREVDRRTPLCLLVREAKQSGCNQDNKSVLAARPKKVKVCGRCFPCSLSNMNNRTSVFWGRESLHHRFWVVHIVDAIEWVNVYHDP